MLGDWSEYVLVRDCISSPAAAIAEGARRHGSESTKPCGGRVSLQSLMTARDNPDCYGRPNEDTVKKLPLFRVPIPRQIKISLGLSGRRAALGGGRSQQTTKPRPIQNKVTARG